MYGVMNTLSEYTYFYMPKNITSYTFLLVFKSLLCILKWSVYKYFVRRFQSNRQSCICIEIDKTVNNINPVFMKKIFLLRKAGRIIRSNYKFYLEMAEINQEGFYVNTNQKHLNFQKVS